MADLKATLEELPQLWVLVKSSEFHSDITAICGQMGGLALFLSY